MAEVLAELVARIKADATELKQGLAEGEKAVDETGKSISQKIGDWANKYSKQLRTVGVAFTAIGAAGMKMVDTSKELNSQLGATGITIGASTKEMRDLALSTTNVTFPLQSVIKTFDLLSKAGVRNTTEMQKSANAFDALADATGSSAEVVADLLLPAFKLFGEAIPTTSKELDKFTWLTKNTLVDLTDFGTLLTRMAPYMDDLKLSMDDAIVTLAALGEQGIVGTAATLKLRTAITQAASEGKELKDTLGITNEEMGKYRGQMLGAVGITDQYAAQLNTQYTLLDKVKQKFSEITLSASGFLEPLEPILAAMTALGPAMIFLSTSMGRATITTLAHVAALTAHKIATIASTVAQWAFNVALSANPIGLIIIAIGGLVAAGIALYKNVDKVAHFFQDAWSNMKNAALHAIDFILAGLQRFLGWIPGLGNKIDQARAKIANIIESEKIARDIRDLERDLEGLTETVKAEFGKQAQEIQASYNKQRLALQKAQDAAIEAINKEYGIGEAAKDVAETRIEAAKRATSEIKEQYAREKDIAKDRYDSEMAGIRDLYDFKLATLDIETDNTVKALQNQIDAIDKQTENEELALTRQAEKERTIDLQRAVSSAKTVEEAAEAEQKLAAYTTEIKRNELLRQRTEEKDTLRARISEAREYAQSEKERIQTEEKAALASLKTRFEVEIETYNQLSAMADIDLKGKLLRLETDRLAKIDTEKQKLDAEIARLDIAEKADIEFYAKQLASANQQVKDINVTYDALQKRYDIEIVTTYSTATRLETPPIEKTETIAPHSLGGISPWGFPEFASGGIVPGSIGQPQLAMVHGGETIIPANESANNITINFTQPMFLEREDQMNQLVDKIRKGIQRQDRLRFGGAFSG